MNITIYTSPSCGPCKQIKPILFKAAVERDWTVTEHSIMDGIPDGVRAVPTVRVFNEDGTFKQYLGTGEIKDALGL
jgi:glutaredoxin